MYDKLLERLRDWPRVCIQYDGSVDQLHDEAADAIKQLSDAGSAYGRGWTLGYDAGREESKPRWIPVTERLPKEGEFVLVYGDLYPNKHDGGVIAVSKRMDWNYWQGFGRERDITHWMPLPEPPKEDKP